MSDAPPGARPRARLAAALAAAVGLAALVGFGLGIDARTTPHFVDESAYISQAFYLDRLLSDRDAPAWLWYPAIDLPPLPKYLIGLALHAAGEPLPAPRDAAEWYGSTRTRPESETALIVARMPSVLLGAVGCVATFAIGVMLGGWRVGLLAAVLLGFNGLYVQQARRAMADVPAEALILSTEAVALAAWRGGLSGRWGIARVVAMLGVAGVLGGLAVLAKLNGGLALMVVASWVVLAASLPGFAARRKVGIVAGGLAAGVVAFGTFAALNPTLTARPTGRVRPQLRPLAGLGMFERAGVLIRHRAEVSRSGRDQFPDDALRTPAEKLAAVAVQGFGRFGPLGRRRVVDGHLAFDSTRRYDRAQDAGAVLWLPLVAAGAVWAWRRGRRQLRDGQPPTAWAVLLQAAVALATVATFIPLAWDRYFLSIQPGSALLVAGLAVAALDRLRGGGGA